MARTTIYPGEHLAEELRELEISAAELARQGVPLRHGDPATSCEASRRPRREACRCLRLCRQLLEWIYRRNAQRCKMSNIPSQNYQLMAVGRRTNHDVSESGSKASAAGEIR